MPETEPRAAQAAAFAEELARVGHLIRSGVPGLYGWGGTFEAVIEHFDRLVAKHAPDVETETLRFPPVLSRASYERTDHVETMPHLLGTVHSFMGSESDHSEMVGRLRGGDRWTDALDPTDAVMAPAACYPLYPTATGTLPEGGRTVNLLGYVFRNEPSEDPVRLQMFRQREYVRIGTPEEAVAHRDDWVTRSEEIFAAVGLEVQTRAASDPFFGRGGRVMRATQREQELKYELVVPVTSDRSPTAITSSNYHLDHFGETFDIRTADGAVAHSSCVGFGLERVALALFRAHGMDPEGWSEEIRSVLEL